MNNFSIGVSEDRIVSQFEDFIHSQGVRPHGTLIIQPDGKIHRFCLEGDRLGSKNGAYRLYSDGCPAGWVQDWHKGGEKLLWKYDYSDDERREYGRQQNDSATREKLERERKENERKKAEAEKLHKEEMAKALAMALREYQHSQDFSHETSIISHPYFFQKFETTGLYSPIVALDYVKEHYPICIVRTPIEGGICKAGELLIPMLNVLTGEFQSLIHVPTKPRDDGVFDKPFYSGTSPKGAAHILNTPKSLKADTCLVCEGITTAFAVMILTDGTRPVFSVSSCTNLQAVCECLRKRYTDKRIIIMADNDEAGISKAQHCVDAGVADTIKIPPTIGTDWYDFLIETRKDDTNGN